jgi:hypothetical protein
MSLRLQEFPAVLLAPLTTCQQTESKQISTRPFAVVNNVRSLNSLLAICSSRMLKEYEHYERVTTYKAPLPRHLNLNP